MFKNAKFKVRLGAHYRRVNLVKKGVAQRRMTIIFAFLN
jgi:hypothetical protein